MTLSSAPLCRLAAVAALLALSASFSACDVTSGTSDPSVSEVLQAVTVGNAQATLVRGPFPDAGSGPAPVVEGSAQIIQGGSIVLTLEVPTGAEDLLIGLSEGYDSYYKSRISSQSAIVVITGNAESTLPAFTLLLATETDGEVSQTVTFPVAVNAQAETSNLLQVSLNWNAPVDLDLHVETPGGEDIYYGNRSDDTGGALDLDSNAGCSLDRVDNENITWADTPPAPGRYTVRVDLWSACSFEDPFPYVVTVNRGGVSETFTGTFDPSDADRGGAFSGEIVTTFTL